MIAPGFADVEAQIWMWLMAMIRPGAAMVVAPVFGAANVPLQVRIILAFMIGLVATNSATFALPTDTAISVSNLIFVMGEVLVGLAMGFSLQIGYASVLIAGATISNAMGLGFASMSDPQTGQSTPVIGQFLTILATLLLLAIDGHLMLIATIVKSYSALPPGYAFLGPELFMGIVQFGGTLFSMGLLIALPVGGALILAGVGVDPAGIGLILGVDRFLDMGRTTLNVIGDLVAAQVISATSAEEVPEPSS